MLKFDTQALIQGLNVAITKEINVLTDWLWSQVQSKAPPQVDRAQVHKQVSVVAGMIVGEVSAAGIGALTTEWGSGSLADEGNPAWDEYTQSRYYNPARFPYGHPITGRPAGDYVNLDGKVVHSSGAAAGLNLEAWLPPREPQHWMQEIVALSQPYIIERLVATIQAFPFHTYISDGR